MKEPNLTVTKSAWNAITWFRILCFWLIIPLIIMIVEIVKVKHEKIYFYDDKVIVKKGVLNKKEQQFMFAGVLSVTISQTLWGRMCNYGDVRVDCVGKWDVNTDGIKNPQELKKYLDGKIVAKDDYNTHLVA